jgi:hypothetical protein
MCESRSGNPELKCSVFTAALLRLRESKGVMRMFVGGGIGTIIGKHYL